MEGITLKKLEDLFEKTCSNRSILLETKARALAKLASKLTSRSDLVEKAIDVCEEAENYRTSAELSEKIGDNNRAINNYVRCKDFEQAAKLSEKMGNHDQAMDFYVQASEHQYSNSQNAQRVYAREKAVELAESISIEKAIKISEKLGLTYKTISLCLKGGDVRKAVKKSVEAIKRQDKIDDSIEDYLCTTSNSAAKVVDSIIELFDDKEAAIEVCQRSGRPFQAAGMLMEIEEVEKAIDTYLAANYFDQALAACREKKDLKKVLRTAKKKKYFSVALRAAEKLGEENQIKKIYSQQIDTYEKNKENICAGRICEKIGDFNRAINNYEVFGRFDLAEKVAREIGDEKRADEFHRKDYFQKIKHLENRKDYAKALELAKREDDKGRIDTYKILV